MAMADVDVLIVGAGPTGLTLACELARSGVSFRIVELSPGPQPGSRGKGLQPRSLEVFDDLGIVDRILANGRMAMPVTSVDAAGEETRTGREPPAPRPDVPYPATLLTPQWRVEEALRARLAALGGSVSFGTALDHFDQSGTAVSATLVENGESRTIAARWLVGCDGGRSAVRKAAGIDFLGDTFDQFRMIVADVQAEGLDRDSWHVWGHAEGFFALCPLPSTDAFQLQASIGPHQDPALSRANMQAILERRTGRRDVRLAEPSWSSLWRANVRMVDRYRDGRVFLAGDAAHVHSPAGGQGMNTGIQDAHNLAWKLAAVARGAPDALLDSYEAERLPVAAGVLALSNELAMSTARRRNLTIARDPRTLQLGLHYRESALSCDTRADGEGLRAGDRAPDASGLRGEAGVCRLFDLLRGDHFTLLGFGAMPAGLSLPGALRLRSIRITDAPAGPDDFADGDGHLRDAYAPAGDTLFVIRPDGYIGFVSDDGGAVAGYFARLFGTADHAAG